MAKTSIQDIAKAIVEKHGLSQNDAEKFVVTLFDVLNDGLHKEKIVKIKGLGTFKVIDVRERESVNVNTGERVLIDSHGKITFTPDTVMRDLINKPFAQFETVVLNEGVNLDEMSNTQGYTNFDKEEEETKGQNNDITGNNGLKSMTMPDSNINEKEDDINSTNKILKNEEPNRLNNITKNHDSIQQGNMSKQNITEQTNTDSQKNPEELHEEYPDTVIEESEEIISNESKKQLQQNEYEDKNNIQSVYKTIKTLENGQHPNIYSDNADENSKKNQAKSAMLLILAFLFAAITLIIGYYWGASSVGPIIRYKTVHIINDPASTTVGKDTLHIIDTTDTKKTNIVLEKEEYKTTDNTPHTQNKPQKPTLDNARAMVNTGAYKITGTAQTITVKKGETLKKISKFYLGEGMECYIQIHNGITDVKEGMRLKIPQLQLKKRN